MWHDFYGYLCKSFLNFSQTEYYRYTLLNVMQSINIIKVPLQSYLPTLWLWWSSTLMQLPWKKWHASQGYPVTLWAISFLLESSPYFNQSFFSYSSPWFHFERDFVTHINHASLQPWFILVLICYAHLKCYLDFVFVRMWLAIAINSRQMWLVLCNVD